MTTSFWRSYLVGGADVYVLTEGVTFGQRGGAVLHQIEGFEGPEGSQELLHLKQMWPHDAGSICCVHHLQHI